MTIVAARPRGRTLQAVFGECRVGWRETTTAGVAQSVELVLTSPPEGMGVSMSPGGPPIARAPGSFHPAVCTFSSALCSDQALQVANPGLCGDRGMPATRKLRG